MQAAVLLVVVHPPVQVVEEEEEIDAGVESTAVFQTVSLGQSDSPSQLLENIHSLSPSAAAQKNVNAAASFQSKNYSNALSLWPCMLIKRIAKITIQLTCPVHVRRWLRRRRRRRARRSPLPTGNARTMHYLHAPKFGSIASEKP